MIARNIIERVYTLKNSYYMEFIKEPYIVVLAPWMVSYLREETKKICDKYQMIQGADVELLLGMMIIESPKIKDLNDIEVY